MTESQCDNFSLKYRKYFVSGGGGGRGRGGSEKQYHAFMSLLNSTFN